MTQNIDQAVAGGFDAATLHIWDADAATPGIKDALDQGVIMTSFFNPIGNTGIPTARSDEAAVSLEIGAQMARALQRFRPEEFLPGAQHEIDADLIRADAGGRGASRSLHAASTPA